MSTVERENYETYRRSERPLPSGYQSNSSMGGDYQHRDNTWREQTRPPPRSMSPPPLQHDSRPMRSEMPVNRPPPRWDSQASNSRMAPVPYSGYSSEGPPQEYFWESPDGNEYVYENARNNESGSEYFYESARTSITPPRQPMMGPSPRMSRMSSPDRGPRGSQRASSMPRRPSGGYNRDTRENRDYRDHREYRDTYSNPSPMQQRDMPPMGPPHSQHPQLQGPPDMGPPMGQMPVCPPGCAPGPMQMGGRDMGRDMGREMGGRMGGMGGNYGPPSQRYSPPPRSSSPFRLSQRYEEPANSYEDETYSFKRRTSQTPPPMPRDSYPNPEYPARSSSPPPAPPGYSNSRSWTSPPRTSYDTYMTYTPEGEPYEIIEEYTTTTTTTTEYR